MKLKTILALIAVTTLAAVTSPAQTFTNAALNNLVQQVSAKLKEGKTTEAALAPELKQFDVLLAAQKGEKNVAAAEIIYMKAMLYLQVFDNPEKGGELMRTLKNDYGDTKFGQNAAKIVDQIEKQGEAKKVQSAIAPGQPFPDFAEKDLDGKPLSVGALKGRVVLIDFWATWCGPCRAELPNVIATYKKHHAKGFEVIGVSLDSDRSKLDAFLKKTEGMVWPQYFDGEGWGNKLAAKYGVESIPFTVLVGPDGKIIGKDLRGEALEAAVARALAKK